MLGQHPFVVVGFDVVATSGTGAAPARRRAARGEPGNATEQVVGPSAQIDQRAGVLAGERDDGDRAVGAGEGWFDLVVALGQVLGDRGGQVGDAHGGVAAVVADLHR